MPRRNPSKAFGEVFRENMLGSGAWENEVARKTIRQPDSTVQGDREAAATSPTPLGQRPIAAGKGEFDAIALNEEDLDEGSASEATGAPAPITLVPTSTTNPKRPRTVAAGYMPSTKTLSVIFRDGVLYNYYEVSSLEWANFKRARSKGRFIAVYLDLKPRGYPDSGPMSLFARAELEAIRTKQFIRAGRQPGQSQSSRRGTGYHSGNLGGTGRRRSREGTQ